MIKAPDYTEMPNPFRRGSAPRHMSIPPGSIWPRLYVMSMLLVVIVGTMIYMKRTLDKPPAAKAGRPGPGEIDFTVRGGAPGQEKPGEAVPPTIVPSPLPQEGPISFRDLAAPFKDGREPVVKETPEFVNLVNAFAKGVKPAEFSARVNPAVTIDAAYNDPLKHRGEVIRCRGPIHKIYTERLLATTPDNIEFVYLGIMQEVPGNRTIFFYMAERPSDPATGQPIAFQSYKREGEDILTDWVEMEGIFLRQYQYENQYVDSQGRQGLARAAVCFVKNIKRVPRPQIVDPRGGFVFVVAALGVVLAAAVIVAGVMARKYGKGDLQWNLLRLRREKGLGPVLPPRPPVAGVLGDEVPKPDPPAPPPA